MKKILAVLMAVLCMLSLCGCDMGTLSHSLHESEDNWYKATCTSPRTCTICGYTEGEPTAHSRDVGTCAYCGEFINGELYRDIESKLDSVHTYLSATCDYIIEKNYDGDVNWTSLAYAIHSTVDENAVHIQELISLCGDSTNLYMVKTYLQSALNALPKYDAYMTTSESMGYCTDVLEATLSILDACEAFEKIE